MFNYRDYSKFFDICPTPCIYGVALKDSDGLFIDFNIKYTNYNMCKLLNLEIEDIKNKSIKNIIPGIIESNLNCKKKDNEEYIDTLNGWYKIDIVSLEDDRYILWFIENKEINHIKLMEILEDTMPDYIFFKDTKSRIIDCNKSYAEKLMKMNKIDIIGKCDHELGMVYEESIMYRERDLEVMESKQTKTYYEEVTLNDGSLVYLETIKTPLISDIGEVIGVIGISRDITYRKTIEDTVEKARLESFANLSHELRTPLNLIFSSIQVLDKGYKIINKKIGKEDDKYLPIIRQNGYRLLKLVDNIIDSSKMSYGSIEFEPKNYDIVSFVEDICQSVSDFAKQNSMNIIFDTDIEEKVIGFDLYKMERIILNLLSNALKFNKNDGTIEVVIKDKDGMVEISVKDEGIGISKNDLDLVFDRFKQIKNKESDTKVGSGIGLSLVKSLVEIHKGDISVKSTLGEGTEFVINIPDITYDNESDIESKESLKEKFVQKIEVEFSDIYI